MQETCPYPLLFPLCVSPGWWSQCNESGWASFSTNMRAVSSSKEQQAAGKQLESWRQKKCYVSIDLLRKIQKTWPYPSQHYENLFLNMLYSCYVRCSLFPHSSFHLFELAKVWRCYVKHIRALYLSHKSHQAGKGTSSPWHGGDTERSHQVAGSHIREEESPWHSSR